MSRKPKVLFLCTGNSCCTQMAEAWTRHLKAHVVEAYSAGVQSTGVDKRAIKAMAEAGIDISLQWSKDIDFLRIDFDYVIILCNQAREACASFPAGTPIIHAGFFDPLPSAANARTEEEAMDHYRRVRDEIKEFVEDFELFNERAVA